MKTSQRIAQKALASRGKRKLARKVRAVESATPDWNAIKERLVAAVNDAYKWRLLKSNFQYGTDTKITDRYLKEQGNQLVGEIEHEPSGEKKKFTITVDIK